MKGKNNLAEGNFIIKLQGKLKNITFREWVLGILGIVVAALILYYVFGIK